MNKQHLQIGNLIYRPCCADKVIEIRSNGIIGCDKLRGLISFSEVEPIPITEEWLVNNGFEKFYDDICVFSYYTKEVDGNYIDIKLDCSNIDENHVVCHVDNCYRCTIGCADIQYVHQLQNFLNLLDIKMKVEP